MLMMSSLITFLSPMHSAVFPLSSDLHNSQGLWPTKNLAESGDKDGPFLDLLTKLTSSHI